MKNHPGTNPASCRVLPENADSPENPVRRI